MLVLSRKTEQRIQIGRDVTITILQVKGHAVRVGVEAPHGMKVLRGELVSDLSTEALVETSQEGCATGEHGADAVVKRPQARPASSRAGASAPARSRSAASFSLRRSVASFRATDDFLLLFS